MCSCDVALISLFMVEKMSARDDGDEVVCVRERDGEKSSARRDDFGAAHVHEFDRGNWTSSGAIHASLSNSSTNEKAQAAEKTARARKHACE